MSRPVCHAVLVLCVLAGCSSEPPSSPEAESDRTSSSSADAPGRATGAGGSGGGNRPAVVLTARLVPDPLTRRGPISVHVEAEDPEGGPVRLSHQWYLNGEPLAGETERSLSPDRVVPGDRVGVEVTPRDVRGVGVPHRTADVTVVNTPPTVTRIEFSPFPVRVGDRMTVAVETQDPDGDEVVHEVRWFRNGEALADPGSEGLDTSAFARGDEVSVEVIANDGMEDGEPQRSDPLTIDNSPPEITSSPPPAARGEVYVYDLRARDRDGDALTYALESGPPGMTVDPKSGAVRWPFSKDEAGEYQVRVAVSDGFVDEPTVQEFTLSFGGGGR